MRVSDLAVLDGVVWDEDTEEIADGVYQVRGGTERAPSAVPGR